MNLRSFKMVTAVAATLVLAERPAPAADPTTADCLAASDSSLKLGNDHRLRAERSQLLVCAASTCPADIRKDCAVRVDEVNAQIPTIVFTAKDSRGADLVAVKVTMDGEVVAERLGGTALSLDPGEHGFTFESEGEPPLNRKLVIVQGQKDRREQLTFGTSQAAEASPAPTSTPTTTPADTQGMGTQRMLALVAGGVGVAGLGVGTAFGLVAMSQKSAAQSACPSLCTTQDGVNKWSAAGSSATLSTVGFIVGGVGVAGAALLWLTAPSGSSATSAQVGIAPGAVVVKGTW